VSTSIEIHPTGNALPGSEGDGESWTVVPVTCPFDFAIVPGAEAEAALATLRSELPGMSPLIFGNPQRAAALIRTINVAIQPDEILKHAASLDLDDWFAERVTYLRRRAGDSTEPLPRHGEWPAESVPATDLYMVRELRGLISPQVVIGLLPCEDHTAAAAYLRFGGWDDCPHPQVHVAVARRWASSHGAVLVANTSSTLEFRVARPIATREAAMEMAITHYLYNFETVEQPGSIELAAASLVGSSVWQFWWD
jgi:Domain of unknown function (DUF4253)